MSSKNRPTSRRYSEEEKAQAVRLVCQARAEGRGHGAIGRVAEQLGYGTESVRTWVRQADIDVGEAPGTTTEDAQRIRELEAECRELKRANEILRRASAFMWTTRLCGLGRRPPTTAVVTRGGAGWASPHNHRLSRKARRASGGR